MIPPAPRSPPIAAVIFDLGGVLIEIDFPGAFAHWARCAGVSPEELRARFRFDETLARYECGEVAARDYFASLRGSLGIDIPDDELERGWCAIFGDEIPGMREVLESIEGRAPLYVFSNTNLDHQRIWSPRFAALLRPFRQVFTSCELGKRKPTPEAFHSVAQAIDVPPENILFFDDLLENVQGALAIGMQAVHVRDIHDVTHAIHGCNWAPIL